MIAFSQASFSQINSDKIWNKSTLDTNAQSGSFILKVLSYNVKGLPWPAAKNTKKRMKKIGKQLAFLRSQGKAPHIVLLQEAIQSDSKLRERANYPIQYEGPDTSTPGHRENDRKFTTYKSGLWILSELPLSDAVNISYPTGACSGWDCMANKGWQHIKVHIPGLDVPIELFNTHMQAHVKRQAEIDARKIQILAVTDYLNTNLNGSEPVIFAGDFNLKPNRAGYPLFVKESGLINVGNLCINSDSCQKGSKSSESDIYARSNDHHFYRSGIRVKIEPIYIDRSFGRYYEDGKNLSDHDGYEVHYLVSWD